ncbi:DUF6502 family protein [Roseateles sp.]|uniref:DUF6502 family protein n=1 Tax=Roseateles sp. TaxID=1971397 RepID=UPI003D0F3EA0
MSPNTKASLALRCVLRVMQPLARLLVKQGVGYPEFAQALKPVFLSVAKTELAAQAMPQTDSAVSLLSGVHRRDVRTLGRAAEEGVGMSEPLNLVGQIVARWMSAAPFRGTDGRARALPRQAEGGGFDQLVAEVSRDVRPRAVLDEMQRLGVAREDAEGVHLVVDGFAPRLGFEEMAEAFALNLRDHLAAGSANLLGEQSFLERSVYSDELSEASVQHLQAVAGQAWKLAFDQVMRETQTRFDLDAVEAAPAARQHRVRFGVYFYSEKEESS